ncbi:hypothetical protein AX16_010806 [Volvariella volvacea WC 439]|nr:hypothetical protein AX16_010806 [Volvariella volvacea WC 439]
MYLFHLDQQGLLPPSPLRKQERYFFLYGTLALPHILRKVLGLERVPECPSACVTGYVLRMWGPHPALVGAGGGSEDKVEGNAWFGSEQDLERLQMYLGENFRCRTDAINAEGQWMYPGWAFVWDGDESELYDGVFNHPNSIKTQMKNSSGPKFLD